MPVPGVGDRALLRVDPLKPGDIHRYSGRVTKIIAKKQAQVLGIFRALPEGGGRLVPVDKKARERELADPARRRRRGAGRRPRRRLGGEARPLRPADTPR